MTKQAYSRKPRTDKAVKARASDLRAHFKLAWEVCKMLRGKGIKETQRYLDEVLAHRRCIPFTRFNKHVGRTGQAIQFGVTQGRWPEKVIKIVQGLLKSLEGNAVAKQLEVDKLVIGHVQVNRAQKGRRRTYRAHGRVTPYMSSNCHIELWAEIPPTDVPRADKKKAGLSLKKIAKTKIRRFVNVGGDKK